MQPLVHCVWAAGPVFFDASMFRAQHYAEKAKIKLQTGNESKLFEGSIRFGLFIWKVCVGG